MSQYRLIFTNVGLSKKQNAELNNNYIQITKFAVGSGVITDLLPTMTTLIKEEYRANIDNVDTKNGTTIFDLVIPTTVGGFYIKEVALFDIDGDCICIGNVPITYKVSQDEGASKAIHLKVLTTSTNTENIVFNTDNSLVYATVSFVNSHIQDKNNPHNVTKVQIGLENVANLAPKDLPLSNAAISALALKANSIDVNNSLALKLNYTDVKNSLTATDTNKPLSAAQGKILKGYIDQINTLLLSDTSSLDTLQEIVDFIELNRATLDTLGIPNIAGLQTALNAKLNASTYTAADVLVKIKTVDGNGSGLDADTLDGYEGAYLAGLNYGASNVDPNAATMPYILTNHANSPSTSFYWHIRTQTYGSISSTSNRAQIAIQYSGGNQVYARSCSGGTWTAWVRLDNNGNAATATKLATARKITLSGDIIGSITFDGSADVSSSVTVQDDSHNHTIANIDGLQTVLEQKVYIVSQSFGVNGYIKWSNGWIEQWGYINTTANPHTIAFPIAFPTACLNLLTTGVYPGDGTASVYAFGPTVNNFKLYTDHYNVDAYWSAVGY